MRLFKNILASAAVVLAVASCVAVEGVDTFSKKPVAPVMAAHNTILITEATKTEDVTFVWSKARFIDAADYLYNLYVTCGEKTAALAENIAATSYSLSKEEFRTFMKSEFELVQNSTHQISVYTAITDNAGKVYESAPVTVSVYVFDNAVASELTGLETELVLDKETPAEELALLTWTEPRLVYGEDVTYKVVLKIGEGEEKELVAGTYDTEYTTTVDALNDAVASAGGVEEQANDVDFIVYACCPSIPDGVASNIVTISVTTYVASFPETLWVAGSHQGWDPATAPTLKQSTTVKGLYQGFLDLTTADGSDVEFKFCPAPNWNAGEYGFDNVTTNKSGNLQVNVASSETVGGNNTKTPSGFYYVKLDKKFGTLDMIQVKNLELIGSFAASGWSNPISMNWDADSQSWTSAEEVVLKANDEILVRFNSAWDHKFGGSFNAIEFAGDNIKFAGAEGSYQVVLNASSADFTMRAVNMASDYFLVGKATGWSTTDKILPLYPTSATAFSFTTKMADGDNYYKFWAAADFGNWDLAYGFISGDCSDANGSLTQGGSTGSLRFPTADEYYTTTFDLSANTFTQTKLENQNPVEYSSIGVVGLFNGWDEDSDDYQMIQVEKAPHNWYLLDFEIADVSNGAAVEIKFNANKAWAISWGGGIDFDANRFGTLSGDANCFITPGTYDIYFNDITSQYLFIKK